MVLDAEGICIANVPAQCSFGGSRRSQVHLGTSLFERRAASVHERSNGTKWQATHLGKDPGLRSILERTAHHLVNTPSSSNMHKLILGYTITFLRVELI